MLRKLNSKEYKRKLEHQIYLAQEHPARIYDLTDCDLSQIPKGVFTFCKVLRKYSLNLSDNNIVSLESGGNLDDLSLLGELILTNNKFKQLSSNFNKLCNLQKLIMNDNKLTKFPTVLVELLNLKILNLKDNLIRIIPQEVGDFKSLKIFNMSRNPVNVLNPEICQIETLEEFHIDLSCIKNISQEILSSGYDNIWRHLCQVTNRQYKEIRFNVKNVQIRLDNSETDISSNKDKRHYSYPSGSHEFNQTSRDIDDDLLEHERKLTIFESEDKQKHVDLIKKKIEMEDETIKAILQKKKLETDRLFNRLKYEELSSTELVESILDYNAKSMKREELKNKLMSQAYEQENEVNIKLTEDEMNVVLDNMNTTLQRATEAFLKRKDCENMAFPNERYSFRGSNSCTPEYLDQLKETERQKLAFQRLQLEKDSQIQRLQESICLIELKLQQLSAQEMNNSHISDSNPDSRANLMTLLQKLRKERAQREHDLNEQIDYMDSKRDVNQKDFWIIQYQRLLDEKAKSDLEIEELLMLANVSKWTPVLIQHNFTFEMVLNMTENDLVDLKLGDDLERRRFLFFLKEWKFNPIKSHVDTAASAPSEIYRSIEEKSSGLAVPSAPPLERSVSYANDETDVVLARKETECCICLNLEARILLLNCGHVCCCKQCSLTVRQCPLCRQKIVQRVNLEFDV